VSRRDPRRAAAVLWTSANRIFGCSRPGLVAAILRGMALGISPVAAVGASLGRAIDGEETAWVLEAGEILQNLEATERDEYDALHDGANGRTGSPPGRAVTPGL
jgi:hypothetical protein